MRKKRPFLLFWLLGFFLLLILSAAASGKMTADISQKNTEKIVASKESVDKFKKEFSTYWWEDYKLVANYDKGELEIYLPKDKENNQFINIDDVLSAISFRQYQFKDKHLTVLLLTNKGERLARLKNGKVKTSYSDKINVDVVDKRLKEWIKTNEQVKKISESTTTSDSPTAPPSTSGETGVNAVNNQSELNQNNQ
ncbi:hypothetical protein F6X86_06205 [Enterococcus durans]|uniref:Uncharacterized protein n=1 Tax=Enterococcus durans TaxID=53345 RepID=A0A5N0Z208_9ENTE|nr:MULTISPECIES: hypothetical protein [Enterococcus]KAA9179137.1 hypothetical protein F6X86_06205 [Enterococcus durans]KAA9187736.1 hypothetical protein F6X90_02365 [Enterococcus durans]KAA9188059.1 hypothetical protein F6X85_02460 [Enterococcus durans]KAA9193040.1 hypothetical protein F6X88_07650 [Enterococcus durans]KAA9193747.1 hypothetical protein F6Y12_02375 [Enterococcus durans]